MRKTFGPFDDFLIERLFQPLTDLIAQRGGFSRSAASCFCIDIASLAWIVSRAQGLSDAAAHWDGAALMGPARLMLGLVALVSLRTLLRKSGGNGLGNPLRAAMRPHRAVALMLLLARLAQIHAIDLADTADTVMLVFAVSAMYLGACAERPPLRRRWQLFASTKAG